ncbi:MAG: glycosyltransferase family 4 protein [Xanthobacteraceae bacterium]
MGETPPESLRILHVFRAPVGGLFRHVLDLTRGQIERGHKVGLIADSTTGGPQAEAALAGLAKDLALGTSRIPVGRHLGLRDIAGVRHVSRRIAETGAQVIHGHGAKGGAYARLASAPKGVIRVYTPHGGSLLFRPNALFGSFYLLLENILMRRGDLFLFESAYSEQVFRAKIGNPKGIVQVVHNGVGEADFGPVQLAADATDIVFVGEFRPVKGIDVLIDATALLHHAGRRVTATIVGHGPDERSLRARAVINGLAEFLRFLPAMPARRAFALGRLMVVPSRSESLPYIVLEAAGAGVPLIATRVGGVPEIFGPQSNRLIPPENAQALAVAIAGALDNEATTRDAARELQQRVHESFSAEVMVDHVLDSYRKALKAA